jgi:hypothetical protein
MDTKQRVALFFLLLVLWQNTLSANALSQESSPYLLQHATNPVNWYPWSEAAFLKAKKEHKPIYLSIGYSTCHWCHVMEKESFTDPKTAALLNQYFISIKVDREELPQIDAHYQEIYKRYKNRSGGWPLNVFMTASKEVFFITGYILPAKKSFSEGFDTLLPRLHKLYADKTALHKAVAKLKNTSLTKQTHTKRSDTQSEIKAFTNLIKNSFNKDYPGFGEGKQFPESSKITLMLDVAQLQDDKTLKENYFALLDTMALHGIYDQVDGGFFRYSTDRDWEIPHFEKMLYTQAEVLPLYIRAYALTHKRLYKKVVQESIAMLENKFLWHHLYFSASDADSEHEEGGYYTFTQKEIAKALEKNPHAQEIQEALGFTLAGNMGSKIHLHFDANKRPKGFDAFTKALKLLRLKKEYPFIDTKINTPWNAMMVETLFQAAYIDTKYAQKANQHLKSLTKLMYKNHQLYHQSTPEKKPKQKALLEDYAFFIGALIASYETNYETKDLSFAEYLFWQAKEKFYKNDTWYMSEDFLVEAPADDKYYTSALGKMMQNGIKLAALKESFRYEKFVLANLSRLKNKLQIGKDFSPALLRAAFMQKYGIIVLKSRAEKLREHRTQITEIQYPYLLTLAEDYDAYLACTLRECFFKSNTLEPLLQKINSFVKNLQYNSKK